MRRPGNLGNINYWFGNTDQLPKQSLVNRKLQEIELAKRQNHTPLSPAQRAQRIRDHLKNPRSAMQNR